MFAQLTQILKYREAARLLAWRELQVRYSNSVLGIVWSLLHPLVLTVFFTLVFTVLLQNGVAKYPVFFLAGLLPWNFLSLAVVASTSAITSNSPLVNRVYFPRELLPISIVLANAVNFGIALVPLCVLMLIMQVPLTPTLAWVPVLIAIQFIFTLGLSLGLAALNVYFRDIQHIVDALMLPWFFLTPIAYTFPNNINPLFYQLALVLNPMASLVTAYRQVIYAGASPDLSMLAITAAEAAVVLLIGALMFRRLSPNFSDEL